MRVLWISHSGSVGGGELSLVEGVQALSELGHEVHVVLPQEGPLRARLLHASGISVCWHAPWVHHTPLSAKDMARRAAYNLRHASRQLASLAGDVRAHALITNSLVTPAGALAARRAGLPHVWLLQEYGAEDHGLQFDFTRVLSFAYIGRRADLVLVNSVALQEHFSRRLPGTEIRRVHYAVDVPTGPPERRDGRFRIVLVGGLKPSKGQQDAVAAVNVLASRGVDVELQLVGLEDQPGFERELRSLASDRVRFLGFQPRPSALVARADVVLMCSRMEAFGRVTVEAMKAGKPVIGAAAGATRELIRHGWNGLLYEPNDVAGLASCIERLRRDPDGAREMGRRGRASVQVFNRETYGSELESALAAVVEPADR